MATGTEAGLLELPKPQSVYKHAILDQYAIRFATMTASKLAPKRAVLFDGFAGRGRFDDGSAGSAEHMMLHAQKVKNSTQIDVFLVEQNRADWEKLDAVADEYRGRGINVETQLGDCANFIPTVYDRAQNASLFLFLDPCGAVLPFAMLQPMLTRRGTWPRTEFLMNFSADLIRRAGGQHKAGQVDSAGVAKADSVCGGDWWREVALQAHLAAGGGTWEEAAEAVAVEYAKRLTAGTKFAWAVAPVRRQVHHQPVYFLIFLTTDANGFWVFGVAAAKAREKWLNFLGPDSGGHSETLWDTVAEQLEREHRAAIAAITKNLRLLCADGGTHAVVGRVSEIFGDVYGDVYGEAKETAFTAALRQLASDQEIEFVIKAAKPHKHVIRAGPALRRR